MNMMDFAMNLIRNNPNVANNPRAQQYLDVIRNGDSSKGQQIAENLCKTYGVTKEQALTEARKFFNV